MYAHNVSLFVTHICIIGTFVRGPPGDYIRLTANQEPVQMRWRKLFRDTAGLLMS